LDRFQSNPYCLFSLSFSPNFPATSYNFKVEKSETNFLSFFITLTFLKSLPKGFSLVLRLSNPDYYDNNNPKQHGKPLLSIPLKGFLVCPDELIFDSGNFYFKLLLFWKIFHFECFCAVCLAFNFFGIIGFTDNLYFFEFI